MRHGSLKALEIDNNEEGGAVVPFGDRSSLSSARSMSSPVPGEECHDRVLATGAAG